eukprot:7270269-Ditylum_brightwellii.AAC.1
MELMFAVEHGLDVELVAAGSETKREEALEDDEDAKEKSDEDENAETVDLDLHVPLPNRGYLLYQFCTR